MKYYEVTNVETGMVSILTEVQALKKFGWQEWREVKRNQLPHIVVAVVDKPKKKG